MEEIQSVLEIHKCRWSELYFKGMSEKWQPSLMRNGGRGLFIILTKSYLLLAFHNKDFN